MNLQKVIDYKTFYQRIWNTDLETYLEIDPSLEGIEALEVHENEHCVLRLTQPQEILHTLLGLALDTLEPLQIVFEETIDTIVV